MFQTTRRRLALWYTTVTAVLLLVLATGVYLYVRNTLIDRIDDTLKHVVEVVERSLIIQPLTEQYYRVNIDASFRNNADTVDDDHIDLEWYSPKGELLWSTLTYPSEIPVSFYHRVQTVHLSSDNWLRQVTEPVKLGHQVLGYLRVSHPWFEVTKPIRQLIWDLTWGIFTIVGVVGAIGWFLSGLAMEPVRESYQSLKQFTADASHELRNPIAMIQTNVQMALSYPEGEIQFQQRQLQVVERLTKRLGNLVNDLLFLARSDSGIVERHDQLLPLDALLIEVIEEQRAVAEQKGIFLSLHVLEPKLENYSFSFDDEVFVVKGDWDQLARLFTNLISNALEHSNAKLAPSVTESTSVEDSSTISVEVELELVGRLHHPYLQVKVKDTGIGIPETALPYLFDRFYRLDPSRSRTHTKLRSELLFNRKDAETREQGDTGIEKNKKEEKTTSLNTSQYQPESTATGSGLGLAIAKAIVEHHQGQIEVESTLSLGTTFKVLFPVGKSLVI